jgi:membrane protein DedA with SNARE-associated domain
MVHVDQFLANYGYFALFALLMFGIVGPLIPDETILVLAGIAIHRGHMQPLPTLVVAFAGSLCGITLSYTLGRTGAVFALERVPALKKHLGRHLPEVERWFERLGKWALFFGYFVAGVRHFTALVAGMSGLPVATFALYAYPGGFVWVASFLTIGYYLGEEWEHMAREFDTGVVILAALVAITGFIWWRLKKKTDGGANPGS